MPGVDGIDFIEQVQKTNKAARIILITGDKKIDCAKRMLQLDICALILKPIDRDEIYQAIRQAVLQLEQDRTGHGSPLSKYYRAAGADFPRAEGHERGASDGFSLIPLRADKYRVACCKWESADISENFAQSCIPFSI